MICMLEIFFAYFVLVSIALCLWGASRLSPSRLFKKCNSILLIIYLVILVLWLIPALFCDGSVLYDYRNCIVVNEWVATIIGRFSFFGFFISIATYVSLLAVRLSVFAYKKVHSYFQNRL